MRAFLLVVAALAAACAPPADPVPFPYVLTFATVDRSLHAAQSGGDLMLGPSGATDRAFMLSVRPEVNRLALTISNRTGSTARLLWDEAAFIERDGTSGRVLHEGVRFIDRNNSQPPSAIPAGSSLSDIVVPTSRIYYVSGRYGGWRQHPLLYGNAFSPGERMGILLPLEVDGQRREYTVWLVLSPRAVGTASQ